MNKRISLLLTTSLLLGCSNYSLINKSAATARPTGWSETSHGDDVAPDYGTVFAQDRVKRLDISIEAADWKLMQDNMEELFGSGEGGFGGPSGGFGGMPTSPGASPRPRPSGWPTDANGQPLAFPTPGPNGEMPALPSGFPMPGGGFGGPGGGGGLEFSEEDPIFRPVTLRFEGQTWKYVGMRFKGNSSLRSSWGRSEKMPFRFDFDEFEDEHPEINDQRFFGFKKLTLSSGFSDDSLIREKVAADIFREAGVPAAQTAFYRLYVDIGDGQGSKYFGLYTMVEAPDTPMLQTQFSRDDGNLYKPSGNGAKFGTFDADSFPKKSNEDAADWSDVKAVFSALHASRSDAAQWRAGLEKVFDVDGFLNYLAVNTLIQNWDTYGAMAHNYYLYHDADQKLHWIPWDHNMSLGGGMGGGRNGMPSQTATPALAIQQTATQPTPFTRPGGGGMGRNLSLALSASEVNESWPLIRYLVDDPVYRATYTDYVRKAAAGAFAVDKTRSRFERAHSLIRPYVVGPEGEQEGYTMLSSLDAFEPALNQLYQHLESRHAAATEYLAGQTTP
ncbi:MAG: CotH kinase family protein [Candidatus Sericytochromatia bacterium]